MTEQHRPARPAHLTAPAQRRRNWGRHGWGRQSQPALGRSSELVPAVLADLAGGAVPAARDWVPANAHFTSTGTAVFPLGPPGSGPVAIARLSRAGHRFDRESAALRALAEAELAPDARRLLPVRLATGQIAGHTYVVDTLLPGTAGDRAASTAWPAAQASALATITALHQATARPVVITDPVLHDWLDAPLAVLSGVLRRLPGMTPRNRLARVRGQVAEALLGRTVQVCWVHGDFWAGNLLIDDATGAISGIVDWDLAAGGELPVHDPLHMLLFQRRAQSGRDLGTAVADLLAGRAAWNPAEQAVLTAAGWCWEGQEPPPMRTLVLLHWVRHVAAISVQQRDYAAHSLRGWEIRNVHKVLRGL